MSDLSCSSQAQCRLSGVFGTAVTLAALGLLWALSDGLLSATDVSALLLHLLIWLSPAIGLVALAIWFWLAQQAPGRWTTAAAVLAAVWTVFAMNTMGTS